MYLCRFQSERDKVIISNMMTINRLSIGSEERLDSRDWKFLWLKTCNGKICNALLLFESLKLMYHDCQVTPPHIQIGTHSL
ncbi:unnamed protein product [Sphagnum troendelagicum]|uniref:Uncharacterized protein n=1 Tax=Sphagnum troendelagicum TaxID=128251 RepID=A0ABP0TC05_9BRYO